MQPLEGFSQADRAAVNAVLTDIDDTLTWQGRLVAAAYKSMERLRDHDILVVPVTGRPAGWCDLIARQWPVDAVVGENGAFYFRYDEANRRMVRWFARTPSERQSDRRRLEAVRAEVLARVPGSATSADQGYRESDLAIDYCEDVPRLPQSAVDQIVDIFERHGATAKVSSIHVNGWFGTHDKLATTLTLLNREFGIDARRCNEQIVFVGDSPNDAPMFGFFRNAVGVANCRQYEAVLTHKPAWTAARAGGAGFAELAGLLIKARRDQGAADGSSEGPGAAADAPGGVSALRATP